MGIYAKYVVPKLTHFAMSQAQLRPYRERVVSGATSRVVELGFGSGLNLLFYPVEVQEVIGIDASPKGATFQIPVGRTAGPGSRGPS